MVDRTTRAMRRAVDSRAAAAEAAALDAVDEQWCAVSEECCCVVSEKEEGVEERGERDGEGTAGGDGAAA